MDARPPALLQLAVALVLLLLLLLPLPGGAAGGGGGAVYTNAWAVQILGGPQEAERIARKHGFTNHGHVFGDYYQFRHRWVVRRSLSAHRGTHVRLQREAQVQWAEQQVVKQRKKRDVYEEPTERDEYQEPTDPKFSEQWYLSSPDHQDLNARAAWAQGFTGKGVVVTILDDGIEKDHPDLAANYDPDASYDVNDGDSDPQPRYTQRNENRHGTRCAGEVAAAANNGVCGVGMAYNARIGGVRMLDGEVTDVVEARSLSLNAQHVSVYSASWGPEDDGKTVDGPARLAQEAFSRGVTEGRGGLGSIFVWASGNGGRERDSCNCDGYTNSIYTLSISSTTQRGYVPWYSEACSSTLASTFSSGNPGEKQIVTTDLRQKCTDAHTGTSASAPLAAGIIALTLEANQNLTWRDMQHLVVRTSQPAHLSTDDWTTNAMGRRVSHSYGYGLLDAGAMVSLAQNWTTVGPQRQCVLTLLTEPRDLGSGLVLTRAVDACWGRLDHVSSLEHVQARLSLSHSHRGNLALHLTSPMGTRSTLLAPRPNDFSSEGFNDWAFMTTHSWDEDPRGEWTLEVENAAGGGTSDYGVLTQLILVLYGTGPGAVNPSSPYFPRPSNSSCKTFDAQQVCIECSAGFSLFLQGCVKACPPGFASAPQPLLNLSLEASDLSDLTSVQACVSCSPSCLTCSSPGSASDCLSCPAPHSRLVLGSCLHQNQVQRKSPPSSAGGGVAPAAPSPLAPPGGGVSMAILLSCALVLAALAGAILLLLRRLRGSRGSGGPSDAVGGTAAAAVGLGGFRLGFGFGPAGGGGGRGRKGRVSYKGIPTVWGDEDAEEGGAEGEGPGSESDSDGADGEHGERTAFIRTQSSL